jgi:hypothetical protein
MRILAALAIQTSGIPGSAYTRYGLRVWSMEWSSVNSFA